MSKHHIVVALAMHLATASVAPSMAFDCVVGDDRTQVYFQGEVAGNNSFEPSGLAGVQLSQFLGQHLFYENV